MSGFRLRNVFDPEFQFCKKRKKLSEYSTKIYFTIVQC